MNYDYVLTYDDDQGWMRVRMDEEELSYRQARSKACNLIRSSDPVSVEELSALIDIIVSHETKNDRAPFSFPVL